MTTRNKQITKGDEKVQVGLIQWELEVMVGSVERGEKQKFTKSKEKMSENPSQSIGCSL